MKVFHVTVKPHCPFRIQMSDDELVAAMQFRDTDGVPFYWMLITPELARRLIEEFGMTVAFTLPDTPDAQVSG